MNTLRNKSINKLLILLLSSPLVSFGQTFELFDGQSMCMIGKGQGQDATPLNLFSYQTFVLIQF